MHLSWSQHSWGLVAQPRRPSIRVPRVQSALKMISPRTLRLRVVVVLQPVLVGASYSVALADSSVAEALAVLVAMLARLVSQVFLVEVEPRPRAHQRLASLLLRVQARPADYQLVRMMAQSP